MHCLMVYMLYVYLVWYEKANGLKCKEQAISKRLLLYKQG